MDNYIEVIIPVSDNNKKDMLIAMLDSLGYEGFEEGNDDLHAFIEATLYKEDELKDLATKLSISYATATIAPENWNAKWENSFSPVIVDDFCAVRADFHKPVSNVKHEIIITPKMSFGTGHHATTQLMLMFMKSIDFDGKSVLDFGTGTGVLAILAEKLKSLNIVAIDNDEWSYNNTLENCANNNCTSITTHHATLDSQYGTKFDIILANINRNILLQYMTDMYAMLQKSGVLLLSGIMPDDINAITNALNQVGFSKYDIEEKDNWVAIMAVKQEDAKN